MFESKKKYLAPTITEIKFEDKNLVLFLSCSKQTRVADNITNGCCNLMPEQQPASTFDPS